MTATRRVASALLTMVTRQAPPDSREWAQAMVRELEFIEGDWAALSWALGSTTALCRQAVRHEVRVRTRRRRLVTRGITVAVIAFMIHFVVHVATHG